MTSIIWRGPIGTGRLDRVLDRKVGRICRADDSDVALRIQCNPVTLLKIVAAEKAAVARLKIGVKDEEKGISAARRV